MPTATPSAQARVCEGGRAGILKIPMDSQPHTNRSLALAPLGRPSPAGSRGRRVERTGRRRAQVAKEAAAAAAAVGGGADRRSLAPMGELEARETLGPGAQPPLGRARGCEHPHAGAGRRRRAVRALSRLARRLLQTLRGARQQRRRREGAEAEDDEGGFKRRPGPGPGPERERGQAGGGGGARLSLGALSPPPAAAAAAAAASSGDLRPLTPGAQGLKNHGNTCFLNAVVQCLSHTELLAAFLLLALPDQQGPPGLGSGTASGEVTQHLAALVRALWTLEYTPQLSADFKNVVSKYGAQFRGNSQHDALEFLLWLLDRMHEDLCSVSLNQKVKLSGKPLPGQEESSGSESAQPAVQPLKGQSFVQNHFQAQYRSSLTCPHCLKQSNTFDPFLCISLPIPLRQTRPLNVTLVFQSKSQRFVRVGLAVPLFSTVAKLREMVAEEGNISPDQVILTELVQSGFQCSFSDDEDLNTIAEGDSIYAFQAPLSFSRASASRLSGCPHSLPSSPNCSEPEGQRLAHNGAISSEVLHHCGGGRVLLLVCNVAGTGQQAVRFGPPLLMREDRAVSWDQLQQCILGKMRYLMKREAQVQATGSLFQVRVVGGSALCSYLSRQDSWPLYHPAVDRALQFSGPGGPTHVKLVIEWDVNTKECLFGNIQEEVVEDAESVRLKQQLHQQQHSCTLDECFQLYTKEEQLAPDDAWRCPHCQVLQQGMVKLSLWTLPDILVIHLKRFRQVGEQRHKLSTLVHFPLRGLDMAPHVAKRSRGSKWGTWKHPTLEGGQCNFLYDLYAVCNHHGSMQGGHYTAYCRNTLDGHWYSYDDSTVEPVLEEEVSTRGAYILFYQRRSVVPSWSGGSSVRGSTSSSVSEHWLARFSGSNKRESLVSRSSAMCPSLPKTPDSPTLANASTSQEKGGFESRPLVRGVQGRSVSLKASPCKVKLGIPKPMPSRWSFTSKDWPAEPSGELVEYLESGRRPRFTNESIVPLMTKEGEDNGPSLARAKPNTSLTGMGTVESTGKEPTAMENTSTLKRAGKPKEDVGEQPRTPKKLVLSLGTVPPIKDEEPKGKANVNGTLRTGTNLPPSSSQPKSRGVQDPKVMPCVAVREPEGERQPEGKLAVFRVGFLRRDPKRHSESDRHGVMPPAIASSRASLSNGTLSSITESRANSALGRSSTEGLPNGRICRSELDIKRAQSSCSNKGRSDWLLNRSTSLSKAHNSVSLQGCTPPLALEGVSCGTFQRARYHTASLGRRIAVPESSF
ncbi:ubiquitin carboxyl-terminal hydrolase 43 [Elgaria multicarinata webbii]|uniref:ubiquitin carboxyl-terminal hydrolase 43 n=1 Tax=Elgaria multicarinata webbii TaxID=159646 RepID=UPI002FCCFA7B